jgi:hypothetical protein
MKKMIWLVIVAIALSMFPGCASKLVKIASKPSFADIRINDAYVGKTPMYYRFYDNWYPWPMKKTDDYMVAAQLSGHDPDVQIFLESPDTADISYVPDEIFFQLKITEIENAGE